MTMPELSKQQLIELADAKLADANVLRDGTRYGNAYYLGKLPMAVEIFDQSSNIIRISDRYHP